MICDLSYLIRLAQRLPPWITNLLVHLYLQQLTHPPRHHLLRINRSMRLRLLMHRRRHHLCLSVTIVLYLSLSSDAFVGFFAGDAGFFRLVACLGDVPLV